MDSHDIDRTHTHCTGHLCRLTAYLALLLALLSASDGHARARNDLRGPVSPYQYHPFRAVTQPVYETRLHYVGQVWVAIANYGLLGTEDDNSRVAYKDRSVLRIDYSPSFEFPAGSRNDYLYAGGLWVGGIVGQDTLVTMSIDGQSNSAVGEFAGFDTISESSSLVGSPYYDPRARAEQQFYSRFYDTLIIGGTDPVDRRRHRPLNISVSQTSYAWSNRYARQFIIVENWIKNIGTRAIGKVACGLFLDADVLNQVDTDTQQGTIDDISGFLATTPNPAFAGTVRDPVNVAWVADNDGDPVGGAYPFESPRGAVGVRILRAAPSQQMSFNWWVGGASRYNWGPVKTAARPPQAYGGLGSPDGDRSAYYMLNNGEIDYGQLLAAEDHTAEGWRPPLRNSGCDFANGIDTRELLSVGPTCDPLLPGDSIPFVYALCAGNYLHNDARSRFDCSAPYTYLNSLDFDDLGFTATWASWVYDTPGIDSDGDGYSGESRKVDKVQVFFTGDLGPPPAPGGNCQDFGGSPDYTGPQPPDCPIPGRDLFVETHPGEFIVHWSGRNTETAVDRLTGERDFEGYRIYLSKINSPNNYSLVASWDQVNYRRYVWRGRWNPEDTISSFEGLQELYGDDFEPWLYHVASIDSCFRDTILYNGFRFERWSYFEPIAANEGNTYLEGNEERVNVIQRIADSVTVVDGDTISFGTYEVHLTGLNPSNSLYISVTAFDRGSLKFKLDPLESQPGTCSELAVPIYSADVVRDSGLHVSVYPNPYKLSYTGPDGHRTSYYEQGYEAPQKQGRPGELDEQDRRIWFINLPYEATIRIYTLDGDLVRELHHEWPRPSSGVSFSDYSSRMSWDLVTRNTQAVVSGIYIYHISSPLGEQMGKIVIIK